MSRILFYLPIVTERYFRHAVLPLVRLLHGSAEIHVAAPPQWRMTGLTEAMVASCIDLPDMGWHILGGEDHPTLRTRPADPAGLVGFVRSLAPDYVFCRSADSATPMEFPGLVRFMMEGAMPPFAFKPDFAPAMILDGPRFYDQGFSPPLAAEDEALLDALFAPAWSREQARRAAQGRDDYLAEAGLPRDRRIIALPLDVESPNNFFIQLHSANPSNLDLVRTIAASIGEDCVLALTRHPLNLRGDPTVDVSEMDLEPLVAAFPGKIRIVDGATAAGDATASLIEHCDGAIICDSKSFAHAAFRGKPTLRLSAYDSAPWLNAYRDLAAFLADIRRGAAATPDARACATWFAYHYANDAFSPNDPALTADKLLARFDRPVDPARWREGIARVAGSER
jgi:hypothetical protein